MSIFWPRVNSIWNVPLSVTRLALSFCIIFITSRMAGGSQPNVLTKWDAEWSSSASVKLKDLNHKRDELVKATCAFHNTQKEVLLASIVVETLPD